MGKTTSRRGDHPGELPFGCRLIKSKLQMSTVVIRGTRWRRVLAAAFAVLLLAEFASHGLICSGETGSAGQTVSATERGHEDPCRTLVQCGYDQNNRQLPKFTHDSSQHNALFDGLFELAPAPLIAGDQTIPAESGDPIFRPPDPPFHPPKIS
jgi:hypothetical protein